MKSASRVVLPYPAGAEIKVNRLSEVESSQSNRRGRGSSSGRGRGTRNFVRRRMEGFINGWVIIAFASHDLQAFCKSGMVVFNITQVI